MGKGLAIAFLGPDGSGKSTIIDGLVKEDLPFSGIEYFHLKPMVKPKGYINSAVENPHQDKPYSTLKSYAKLIYFIYQYNWGWFKNIRPLKNNSSLVIFDRYFDDMMADPIRYRYGGHSGALKLIRKIIPRPDLYFVLTADANIINKRKQEVPLKELVRQVSEYRNLVDNIKYFSIDVSRTPEEIINEIASAILKKANGNN